MITASISNCENGYAVSISPDDVITRTWIYEKLEDAISRARTAFTTDPVATSGLTDKEIDDLIGRPI
jgi:hypothetical protein